MHTRTVISVFILKFVNYKIRESLATSSWFKECFSRDLKSMVKVEEKFEHIEKYFSKVRSFIGEV